MSRAYRYPDLAAEKGKELFRGNDALFVCCDQGSLDDILLELNNDVPI